MVDGKFDEKPDVGSELLDVDAPLDASGPVPLEEDWLIDTSEEDSVSIRRLARRLQGQSRRYLIQVRSAPEFASRSKDPSGELLALLSPPINVLGGQIEHYWATTSEYDLILVVHLQSHQISLSTLEMAMRAMPEVRVLRTTSLHSLDQPGDDSRAGWRRVIAEELTNEEPTAVDDRDRQSVRESLVLELLHSRDD